MTRERKISIPVTFLPAGRSSGDLRRYKISPDAKNTVMTYRNKTVTATFVDVDDNSFPKVAEAAKAMLQ